MSETTHSLSREVSPALLGGIAAGGLALSMFLAPTVSVWLTTGASGALALLLSLKSPEHGFRALVASPPLRSVVLGVTVGFSMAIATWLLYPWATAAIPGVEREVRALYEMLHAPPGVRVALPILLLVIVSEEIVWRGHVLAAVMRHVPPATAVFIAAAIYALPLSLSGAWILVAVGFCCGATWGLLRLASGGLLAPLLAHILWDLLVMVIHPVEAIG